jgi:hypothetical protein
MFLLEFGEMMIEELRFDEMIMKFERANLPVFVFCDCFQSKVHGWIINLFSSSSRSMYDLKLHFNHC